MKTQYAHYTWKFTINILQFICRLCQNMRISEIIVQNNICLQALDFRVNTKNISFILNISATFKENIKNFGRL